MRASDRLLHARECWIFSPRSPEELEPARRACEGSVRAAREEGEPWYLHDEDLGDEQEIDAIHAKEEDDDDLGGVGLSPADWTDLDATGRYFGVAIPDPVRDRLRACRSWITLELPGGSPEDLPRLALAAARQLLEAAGQGAVDWGNHRPELIEDALSRLPPARLPRRRPARRAPPASEPKSVEISAPLLQYLIDHRRIEPGPGFDPARAAAEIGHLRRSGAGEALIDRLVDRDDIEEVYLSPDELDELLEKW